MDDGSEEEAAGVEVKGQEVDVRSLRGYDLVDHILAGIESMKPRAYRKNRVAPRLPIADPPTGKEIRAWRTALGLTKSDVAMMLGTWPRTIAKWEDGTHAPPAYLLFAMRYLTVVLDPRGAMV